MNVLIFKKNNLFLIVLSLFITQLKSQTNLDFKAPRVIVDAGFGIGINSVKSSSRFVDQEKFIYKAKHSETFNVNILFPNSPFKTHFFYFSIGASYTNFKIKHQFNDFAHTDTTSFNSFEYPENKETNHNYFVASVGAGFSHYWFKNNWIIYQKIAINFNKVSDNSSTQYYTEHHIGNITNYNFDSITEQNPKGYYQTQFNSLQRNIADNFKLENSFNGYLQFGAAYKIKQLAPFVNVELHKYKFGTLIKPSVGIKILFK